MSNQRATEKTTFVIYCYIGSEPFGDPEEVEDRNPQREARLAPRDAYAFLYCGADDSIQSKMYYIDGTVYDARFIGLNWRDGHEILRRTVGNGEADQLVHCRNGKWEPFADEYAEVIPAATAVA